MRYEIEFFGHENIRSNHQKTIEITKESHLTPQGDCIIGVNASSSCADLPDELKNKLKNSETKVYFTIKVGNNELRKSNFTCPRTLSVKCDKASNLVPREIISQLQNPKTKGFFIINVD